MLTLLQTFVRNLPRLILSLVLAIAVWISAVTEADPTQQRIYPRPILIEVIGQNPATMVTNNIPSQVSLTLSAPRSIWDRMISETSPIRAVIDLSGLAAGEHQVTVQIQIGIRPVQIVSFTPPTVAVTLEALSSKVFTVQLVQQGEPAVGFQAETAWISEKSATVSGPESLVNRVQDVRAVLTYNRVTEDINRTLNLQPLDGTGAVVSGVSLTPDKIDVNVPITQRGGYRNVVVKVVLTGQIKNGYRVTNISVFPPVVTIFSSDPSLVLNLPGYVETAPLDLTGTKDDFEVRLSLNLPQGAVVVGDQNVTVQVGIATIEGSLNLNSMKVELVGLADGLKAVVSPAEVGVFLSGPLPMLDILKSQDVKIVVDLTGQRAGTYQRIPQVFLKNTEIRVESIIPPSVEVIVTGKPVLNPSPSPSLSPSPLLTPSPSPTP
jgi:YbbR domain-containing protein